MGGCNGRFKTTNRKKKNILRLFPIRMLVKTTLTEKFLLYGGAIQQAGTVKRKENSKHATSDWMGIEKERGISVTSSVLQFNYQGYCINILDTQDIKTFLKIHIIFNGSRLCSHGH